MKKNIFIFLLTIAMAANSSAQMLSFGIKGGLNYSKLKFDDLSKVVSGGTEYKLTEDEAFQGFHIGVLTRIKLFNLFIQPELLFSTSGGKALVEEIQGGTTVSEVKQVKYNKLDLPVMVGIKLGPIRLNAGPVASVILSSDSEIQDIIPEMETLSRSATFGFQAGVGVDFLKKINFDLRYEGGLSNLKDEFTIAGKDYTFDSRDSRFLISLAYIF